MDVDVLMLVFMDGETRTVHVNDELINDGTSVDELLGLVYHWGQNDFQPVKDRCSVSVGDVIVLDGNNWLVMPMGFSQMTGEELCLYKLIGRRDRQLYCYDRRDRQNN